MRKLALLSLLSLSVSVLFAGCLPAGEEATTEDTTVPAVIEDTTVPAVDDTVVIPAPVVEDTTAPAVIETTAPVAE